MSSRPKGQKRKRPEVTSDMSDDSVTIALPFPAKSKQNNSKMAPYDKELVYWSQQMKSPAQIAKILQVSHELDGKFMSAKAVSNRLDYLNTKGIKAPGVNAASNNLAGLRNF
jgi:hypothetical protein